MMRLPHTKALLAILALLSLAHGCGRAVGKTAWIDYQVDRTALDAVVGNNASEIVPIMEGLLRTINERLGIKGRAEAIENGIIRVHVYDATDRKKLEAIKLQFSIVGAVEFRYAADSRREDDQPVIKQARRLPPDQKTVVVNNRSVAEWTLASIDEFEPGEPDRQFVVTRQLGDQFEVLVLIDSQNLAGQNLTSARMVEVGKDDHTVELTFNAAGATKLRQLTGDSAEQSGSNARLLGLVVDKRILGVMFISRRLDNRIQIGGRTLTEFRAEALVSIFNAGALSVPIREVQDGAIE